MDENELLRRRLFLKDQSIGLLREEIEELKNRLSLYESRDKILSQMKGEFDCALSEQLDRVDLLLRKKA